MALKRRGKAEGDTEAAENTENTEKTKKAPRSEKKASLHSSADRVRTIAAQVVWAVAALLALVLAVGALLVAIDQTNQGNELVQFILDTASAVDFGVFDRKDGVLKFESASANALVNWGLAAIVWLVIGRVLDRLLRP